MQLAWHRWYTRPHGAGVVQAGAIFLAWKFRPACADGVPVEINTDTDRWQNEQSAFQAREIRKLETEWFEKYELHHWIANAGF